MVTGLLAHTCVESTVRFAAELGYDVTMVKDAIASFTDEQMHAALRINIPNYASARWPQTKSSNSPLSQAWECVGSADSADFT
jgi:nicotinamidase-related amidase